MTSTRIQPIFRKNNINIGYFNAKKVWPGNFTHRNTAIKIHNNHSCLVWKSNGITFNQVIEDEMKPKFRVVDIVLSDKHVKSFINYDYIPKKSNPE